MAQEISATVNISITVNGQTASGNTTFKGDLVGDFLGEEQLIATASTALDVGDLTSIRMIYVRNMDATNYVEVDSVSTFDNFPQKLLAGDATLLLPQTATIYAKANTAAAKIWFVAG